MIKLKLMLLFVATLIFSFLIILGLSVINFVYKNEIITEKADFFKAVWVVISTTLYSSAITVSYTHLTLPTSDLV